MFLHRKHSSLQFCHSHSCMYALLEGKRLMDQWTKGMSALLLCLPEKLLVFSACIHWCLDSKILPSTDHFMRMSQEKALNLLAPAGEICHPMSWHAAADAWITQTGLGYLYWTPVLVSWVSDFLSELHEEPFLNQSLYAHEISYPLILQTTRSVEKSKQTNNGEVVSGAWSACHHAEYIYRYSFKMSPIACISTYAFRFYNSKPFFHGSLQWEFPANFP